MDQPLRFNHLGVPVTAPQPGEEYLADYKTYAGPYLDSEFRIQLMRYEAGCPLPEIVQKTPHVAFEVDDVYEAIKGKKVIIEPNSPSLGVLVAFIEEKGVPVELIQIDQTGL